MHPELLSSLAAARRRDVAAALVTHPAPYPVTDLVTGSAGRARPRRARAAVLPRLRVSWTRTTLAAAGGRSRRPGRSVVIVISATRMQ